MHPNRFIPSSAIALAALLAACADAPTATMSARSGLATGSSSALVTGAAAVATVEEYRVCKSGSSGSFSYTVDFASTGPGVDESGTFPLNDGECVSIAQRGGAGANVSVTETGSQAGYQLNHVDVATISAAACVNGTTSNTTIAGPTATGLIKGSAAGTPCLGVLATFYNTLIPVGRIGDFVWEDLNDNGLQDAGEPGIAGITVTLGGAASATATTNVNGYYLFTGLSAGSYTVTVGAGPALYTPAQANVGANDAIDSDGTAPVNVALPFNNSQDLTIDFGFVPPPPEEGGCTRTIGFWKTHAGFTGNNADFVTQYLPIWLGTSGGANSVQVTTATQAVSILGMSGGASNGIVKLKAQLLGAKLSIANGADGAAVAATIAAADAFLAANASSAWSTFTNAQKAAVNAMMTTLDNYNNGLIGPGHCA